MSRRAKKAQQKKPVRRELLLSLNHSEEAFENVIRQIQHIIKRKTCDDEDRSIHFPHIDRGSFKKYIYISDTKKEGAMKYEARKKINIHKLREEVGGVNHEEKES